MHYYSDSISSSISPPFIISSSSSSSVIPRTTSLLKMSRNCCNLELRLFPSDDDSGNNPHRTIRMGDGGGDDDNEKEMSGEDEGQPQKLTIFYDGKVCVSDVTHLQARWIMEEAGKEMVEEKMKRSLSMNDSPNTNNTALVSMKRSLQRFLQKRKDRIHISSSPYHPSSLH